MDKNGDGYVTREELEEVIKQYVSFSDYIFQSFLQEKKEDNPCFEKYLQFFWLFAIFWLIYLLIFYFLKITKDKDVM